MDGFSRIPVPVYHDLFLGRAWSQVWLSELLPRVQPIATAEASASSGFYRESAFWLLFAAFCVHLLGSQND